VTLPEQKIHRAAPLVKWAGGKARLVPELIARMPKRWNRYVEPFIGGGALFFELANDLSLATGWAVINDSNEKLVELYRVAQRDVGGLVIHLETHRIAHSEAYYYKTRERFNTDGFAAGAPRAAAFLYLNRSCFNGLWRVNKLGKFNVPMGDYKTLSLPRIYALFAASRALAKAKITCCDFEDGWSNRVLDGYTTLNAASMDFVYFDPPYAPLNTTSNFTSYTEDGFGERDQRRLAERARILADRGVQVMISNSDVPLIRELYSDSIWRVDVVRAGRSINSKGAKRGEVNELIICGGYDP